MKVYLMIRFKDGILKYDVLKEMCMHQGCYACSNNLIIFVPINIIEEIKELLDECNLKENNDYDIGK